MHKTLVLLLMCALFYPGNSDAAHPLITDDAGTQGKGNSQVEINAAFIHESENGTSAETFEVASLISYGITDSIDFVLGIPFQRLKVEEEGEKMTEGGLSDLSLELKWRFFEKDAFSLAIKPGLTLPTGDEERGLGAGRATFSAFLIGTADMQPWEFHANAGYIRNENNADERENLWHASLASTFAASENLTVVANIGVERNTDRSANTDPAFVLGGLIYALTENLDVDAGIKIGLTRPEDDYSLLFGLAWRF